MSTLNMLKTTLCTTDVAHYEGGHLYKRTVKQLDGLELEIVNGDLHKRKPQTDTTTDTTSEPTQTTQKPEEDTSTAAEQPKATKQRNKRKRKKDDYPVARIRAFILTIDGNYDIGDYLVTLDFNDSSLEKFKERLSQYGRKLDAYAKELGYDTKDIRYSIVIEFSPRNTKRKHAHIAVSNLEGMDEDRLIAMWEGRCPKRGTKASVEVMTSEGIAEKEQELKNGGCDVQTLTRVQGSLAVYLMKGFSDQRHYFGERRVRHSKSVIKAKSASEVLTDTVNERLLNEILKANREQGEYAAKCVLAQALMKNPLYRNYRLIDFYVYDTELDPYYGQRPEDKFKTSYVDYILCRYDDDNSTMEMWKRYAPLVGTLVDDDADETYYSVM